MTPTSTEALKASDISVIVETDHGYVQLIEDVSISLNAGEALGLVGESGSGKSVFSRSAIGLHEDDPSFTVLGSSRLQGRDLIGVKPALLRRRWGSEVSMILQDPLASLNPVRRIGTQLTETIRRHRPRTSRSVAKKIARELLRDVGIADPERRLRVYPHEMSGGMRQRVMIAMALSGNPSLLVADEPTTALDVTVQAQILDLLDKQRRARAMALVLVTHDLSIVAARTERVVVMYAGQVVEEAPTESLFAGPRMPYTRALLDAVPPLVGPTHVRLAAIPGAPPDLSRPITGCRFAARCTFATERCRTDMPVLEPMPDNDRHKVRCHYPLRVSVSAEGASTHV